MEFFCVRSRKQVGFFHLHFALGQRTGFVQAKHIHVRQIFQGVEILHQYIFLGKGNDAGCQADADQQIQSFRQHSQQSGRGAYHGIIHGTVPEQ